MRIVAGRFKGRRLRAPKGDSTRPTTDRVREALFSTLASLADEQLSGRVLDAFAGTGALGLEALSRGAHAVAFVERDRGALSVLRANLEALGVADECQVVPGDARALVRRGALGGEPFSLLLLDPPYRLDAVEVASLIADLVACDLLEEGALVVYEHDSAGVAEWPKGVRGLASKRHGSTTVDIARYERGAGSS